MQFLISFARNASSKSKLGQTFSHPNKVKLNTKNNVSFKVRLGH